MADNTVLNAGSGGDTIATDDVAGVKYQIVKLADGTDQGTGLIAGDATNGLDVDVTRLPALVAGSANIGDVDVLTVPAPLSTTGGGTEATALRVTVANDSTGVISVDDNSSSLTVDNATLSVVGGGLEVTALRVTIANDSTGVVSIDDNAGSLTVDGTISANLNAGTNNIGDVDVLTVPAPLSTTGGGTEATALRVTLANDSTGLVSIDDNAGSLTIDAPVGTPVNVQVGDGTRTATVRDTGTSDSLNVAIVDAAGNQITSFGGGTQYTVNALVPADPV